MSITNDYVAAPLADVIQHGPHLARRVRIIRPRRRRQPIV
jgi:hypothetical protein